MTMTVSYSALVRIDQSEGFCDHFVTNEKAAVKMVTDHGVIISYQFTLAIGPTHSSLTRVAPLSPGPWPVLFS